MGAISSILVDGYNLIGIAHSDLKKERERLITLLSSYAQLKGHEITVVFDGWKSGSHREEVVKTAGIKIIYSRLGDRADEVIKRIISSERRDWIVVTSDREIISSTWSSGGVPVPSELFLRLTEGGGRETSSESESPETGRRERLKGNSRIPSKREKALSRVLKKL